MSARDNKKTRYNSKYTDKPVLAADLAAHIVCQNQAHKNHKTLPFKFWSLSEAHLREFKRQQQAARKLITLYGEQTLINVLQNEKNTHILSLAYEKIIDPLLKKEQYRLEQEKKALLNTKPIVVNKTDVLPKKQDSKQSSLLSKLEALDG